MKKIKNNLSPKNHALALGLLIGGLGIIAVYACNNLEDQKKCGEDQTAYPPTCIRISCGDEAKCNSLVLLGQKDCDPGLPCFCVASFVELYWYHNTEYPPYGWEQRCNMANILGPAPGTTQGGDKATLSGDSCSDYPG